MKRGIALALAAVVVAASAAMGGTLPAKAEVNPYITEGTHTVNGREWRTTCEKYSQTKRCRTEIKATQVSEVNGRFVVKTGWYFNNLTYLPSARSLWQGKNKLGYTNNFVGDDGRKWTTSCDTAVTGRNGCRSYIEASVIEPYQVKGVWKYKWVTKSVFNNIVQFTVAPVKPPTPSNVVTMPDAKLRACINETMRKPITAAISLSSAQSLTELDCSDSRVSNLTGLEKFTNLEELRLDENQISDLTPLKGLKNVESLSLFYNDITSVAPLASMSGLIAIELSDNRISNISALKTLTGLEEISISTNEVRDLTPLAALTNLYWISASDNRISNVSALSGLKNLAYLDLSSNEISEIAPVASLTNLELLSLSGNSVRSISSLKGLKKLTALDAMDNEISDIAALSGLTKMDALFLDSNKIKEVTPLQGLKNLTILSMSDNQVVNVAPLAKLTKLEYLMLAMNDIAIVAPLATLPALQELGLWENPITDKASLDPLIARGCEVYFDEPDWEDIEDGSGPLSWTDAMAKVDIASSFQTI